MKRIFTYMTMLAMAAACTELYGPEPTPLTPDTAAGVEITVSEVADNGFTVTVTPSGEASYYSWLVDESPVAEEVDAETLYGVGYTSVAQGTSKWTSEEPSTTFKVTGVKANTTYQIYAVAGSKMGIAGTVASKSVLTTDTVAPAYANASTEANVVTFTFTEAVKATDLVAGIKVAYYAPYSSAFKKTAAAAGEVTVPASGVVVSGNEATITVPDLPTGCYWTISIPEGAFVDAVGQKLPAYASAYVMSEDGKPVAKGFAGSVDYVELPMLGELELASFSDWTKPFVIPMEPTYAPAGYSSKYFVKVTYESPNKVIEHTLTSGVHYGISEAGFVVYLPEQPAYGADVTISVPTGAFYDIYGNDCEAWETTLIHSFGYTLDDVLGTYEGVSDSYFYGEDVLKLTVAESDNEEYGNIMLTSYMGIKCQSPIYGDFNFDSGVLRLYDGQLFYTHAEYGRFIFAVNNEDYVDLKVLESGTISSPSVWFGAYLYDMNGWYDVYTDVALERVETPAATAAVANVADLKVLEARTL